VSATVFERHDALLVDLDGVVYRGDQATPGAADVLERVRRTGRRVVFLTNNSSRTPDEVAQKLRRLGIPAAPGEVVTSALATAAMLRREGSDGPRTAFVVGGRGIREALEGIGIRLVDAPADRTDLVVIGWDPTSTYDVLRTAGLLVQRGARLIGTNADGSYPAPDGLWPGAGALLAAVVATTSAAPTIAGKPAAPMFEAAADLARASDPLVIGDRLDTDIAGADRMGWDSMLVLTGASRRRDLAFAPVLPTYVGGSIAAAVEAIPQVRLRGATEADRTEAAELVRRAGLPSPTDDAGLSDVVVGLQGGRAAAESVVATASLFRAGEAAVIRSVVVAEEGRGKGVGTLVVGAVLRRAREGGAATAYAFTETAAGFFASMGFHAVGRSDLPPEVRDSEHATGASASADALAFDLQPPPAGTRTD
jgi:glycerol-1-phosphatase